MEAEMKRLAALLQGLEKRQQQRRRLQAHQSPHHQPTAARPHHPFPSLPGHRRHASKHRRGRGLAGAAAAAAAATAAAPPPSRLYRAPLDGPPLLPQAFHDHVLLYGEVPSPPQAAQLELPQPQQDGGRPRLLPPSTGGGGGSDLETHRYHTLVSPGSGRAYQVRRLVGRCKAQNYVALAVPVDPLKGAGEQAQAPPSPAFHVPGRVAIKVLNREWLEALARMEDPPLGELVALLTLAGEWRLPTTTSQAGDAGGLQEGEQEEHPHVVPLIEALVDEGHMYLVFPYADGGELFEAVAEHPSGIPEHDARRYMAQIASGLQHLQRHGLAHGDISLENVMLCKNKYGAAFAPICRLIDLEMARPGIEAQEQQPGQGQGDENAATTGVLALASHLAGEADDVVMPIGVGGSNEATAACLLSTHNNAHAASDLACETATGAQTVRHHSRINNNHSGGGDGQGQQRQQRRRRLAGGKPGYVSPEVIAGYVTDWHAADVWSLGVCLYIMLTGRPLYTHPDDHAFGLLARGEARMVIEHYASAYGIALPPAVVPLVCQMLHPDPSCRPSLAAIAAHPWVTLPPTPAYIPSSSSSSSSHPTTMLPAAVALLSPCATGSSYQQHSNNDTDIGPLAAYTAAMLTPTTTTPNPPTSAPLLSSSNSALSLPSLLTHTLQLNPTPTAVVTAMSPTLSRAVKRRMVAPLTPTSTTPQLTVVAEEQQGGLDLATPSSSSSSKSADSWFHQEQGGEGEGGASPSGPYSPRAAAAASAGLWEMGGGTPRLSVPPSFPQQQQPQHWRQQQHKYQQQEESNDDPPPPSTPLLNPAAAAPPPPSPTPTPLQFVVLLPSPHCASAIAAPLNSSSMSTDPTAVSVDVGGVPAAAVVGMESGGWSSVLTIGPPLLEGQ